jgi:DNA polymerase-3 subunit beta
MRATIDQSAFQNAISLVQGIAQTKISNPIVENTVLKVSSDHFEVLATNLSVSLRVRLEVRDTEEGEIALPAKLLSQVARELPEGDVALHLSKHELKIQAGRSKFNLCGMTTEDFPPFLPNVEGPVLEIPAPIAAQALERTVFATTDERARYQLGGVKFFHDGGKVQWIATDGRRMSRSTHELEDTSGAKCTMLVPARTAQELLRALPDSGNLRITVGEKRVLFEAGNTTIASTLLEDNFPPYQALIPSGYNIKIQMDRDELMAAVRRAQVLASERSRLVQLAAKKGTIVVSGERQEAGGATSEIDATTDSQSAVVSYNAGFLLDFLRVVGPGRLNWSLVNDGGAAYFTKEDDDSFLHIIMPMTVREEEEAAEASGGDDDTEEAEED